MCLPGVQHAGSVQAIGYIQAVLRYVHGSYRDTTVSAELARGTGSLARSELRHAAVDGQPSAAQSSEIDSRDAPIVRVVHVVVDWVYTGRRAGVTAGGASGGGRSLCRGVRDAVTRAAAATLEGVVETDPVARLVGESLNMDISRQLLDLSTANQ